MTEMSLSPDQAPNEKSTKGKLKTLTQGKNAFLTNFMKMYLYITVEQYVKFVFTRMFTSYWACQNNADFVLNTYIHANVNECI